MQDFAMTEIQKLTNNKEIIAYLAEKFPLCFSIEGEAKPLKIGLFQDLSEALKDDERVSKTQLRHALRQYTSNWRYLHGCKAGAMRVDLQGNPVGELEQEHADHAAQQLAEAKALIAQKRAAEKAAKGENEKKRSVRRNQKQGEKHARKPNFNFNNVDMAMLQVGQQVKVKAADHAKNATILEISGDAARVELENGLVITVTADRLFA
ncbi:RNA chaperone ProQ [Aggregatibacter actinomycetemcomitans]|nr:putative solute/DNA competence effector [Aggregatibacter actinomycetemcomitans ANH9381]AMQ92098.1 ABC transporter substrate-binding protein [Aggregatibacter actinomycetemcomitans]QEH45391.1 RNA chaperone ProQ [Aggregatibacter actinomycetemcomitans]QEH47262.1 RNA chaperone ProQ [Aggregatibacter actinomycetemcomitans]QEH49679.1 RNA chaperone ProQ [Aggregatibacter actinomycetemcomitans]